MKTYDEKLKQENDQLKNQETACKLLFDWADATLPNNDYQTVFQNIVQFFKNLPNLFVRFGQNSSLRGAILRVISQHVRPQFISVVAGVTKTSVYNSQNSSLQPLATNSKSPKSKKKEQVLLMKSIIDDIVLPTQSGRNWRRLSTSFSYLFSTYKKNHDQQSPSTQPLSKTTIFNYFKTLNVHQSIETKLCPHCEEAGSERNDAKQNHIDIAKLQFQFYQKVKQHIQNMHTTHTAKRKENGAIQASD